MKKNQPPLVCIFDFLYPVSFFLGLVKCQNRLVGGHSGEPISFSEIVLAAPGDIAAFNFGVEGGGAKDLGGANSSYGSVNRGAV